MNNFLLLLKCDLKKLFAPKKDGKIGVLIAYAILAICILSISIAYTSIFGLILPNDSKHIALALILGIYTIFVLFTTVGNSKILFGAKDYDLLMSLPIKPIEIILSKLFYVYLLNFLGAFICLVPSVITYMIVVESGAITLLNALIVLPFVPLLPLVLGLLIGTIINVVISKVKNKTLITTILAALFLGVYFYFIFSSNYQDAESDEQMAAAILSIQGVFKIFFGYSKGITGNYLYSFSFIGFGLVFAGLYLLILSKCYKQINNIIFSKRSSANFKFDKDKNKSTSVTGALLKREFKLFFSDTTIIMNNLIGPIFSLLLAVAVIFKGGINGLASGLEIEGEEIDIAELERVFSYIIKNLLPYIPVLFMGTCFYSACCISIEGKNMWMVKSLPISAKSYFNTKLLTHLIINLPSAIVCVLAFGITSNAVWYDIIIAIIFTLSYAVFDSILGLTVNVRYHNFDWATTAEVVKRGTSVNIIAVVGILAIIPLIIIQILASFISPYLGFAINFALISGLAFLFYKITYNNDDEKLLKM
ncbi:MAG: hypothetical protein IKJ19_02630 [Clostridia bacterium]|nr:hypothetical protein [Clostridia bacterium]